MATSTRLAAFALDDFDTRSGSATSVLRTIAGLYLRHEPAPVPRHRVVSLAVAAGVATPAAQTAISRLIDRGIFRLADDGPRLQVTEEAQAMFARGNRRIFTPRQMAPRDPWCLVSYSLPETLRAQRHQLRRHFLQLGGGMVGSGLWIFPEYLRIEVEDVLAALSAHDYATLFTTQAPHYPAGPREAAAAWWDLPRLARRHADFLEGTAALDSAATDGPEAYRGYVTMIDAWRALPYLDPGLPEVMLPPSWPGVESRRRFLGLSKAWEHAAARHATALLRD